MPKKEHADQRIIGPYAKANKTEKGNGARLHRICRIHQMIPMSTWRKPKIERKDKWKQQQESETKENWEKENWENI